MLPVIHKLHLANSTGLCYNKMSMFCLRGRNIRISEQRITRLGFSYMPNEIHSHMRWNLYTFLVKRFSLTGWQSFAVMAGCLLLCMVIPYLLGSFNFGLIISRRKYHDDIRIHGSGNAGTTNMLRTYGPKAAALTLVGDMLKAALAVILGYLLVNNQAVAYNEAGRFIGVFGDKPGAAVAGLFVVVGHMFPCFFRFRGGKGVATTGMVILLLNPIVFLILFGIFAIIVLCTKYVSLASVMGVCLYPVLMSAFELRNNGSPTATLLSVVITVLVVFMHRENLKRLKEGKESKLSLGKKKDSAPEPAPDPATLTGKAKRAARQAQHEADIRAAAEEPDYEFVTCTGCGSLIPRSRRKCGYCGTENAQYRPDQSENSGDRKSRQRK